jgi:hypothetical protein
VVEIRLLALEKRERQPLHVIRSHIVLVFSLSKPILFVNLC